MNKPFVVLLLILAIVSASFGLNLVQRDVSRDNNQIKQELLLINNELSSVLISDLIIKYYLYEQGLDEQTMVSTIDYFSHGDISTVTGEYANYPECVTDTGSANGLVKITFSADTILQSNDTLKVVFSLQSTDVTFSLTQNDDWSYKFGQTTTNTNVIGLYLNDGCGEINGSIEIDADAYIKGGGQLNDGAHETIFKGNTLIDNGDSALVLRGGEFFNPLVVSGSVIVDSRSPKFFNGAAFLNGVTVNGSNDLLVERGNLFLEQGYETEFSGRIELNGNNVYGTPGGIYKTRGGGPSGLLNISNNYGTNSGIVELDKNKIYDSLDFPALSNLVPNLNLQLIDSFAIDVEQGWGKEFASTGATSQAINALYEKTQSETPEKLLGGSNGFLVLRPTTTWGNKFNNDGGIFNKKVIWLFDQVDCETSIGSFYKSSDSALTIIVIDNNKKLNRLSGYDYFRGLVWLEKSDIGIYVSEGGVIEGGVIHKNGTFRVEANGTLPLKIKHSEEVFNEIFSAGLFLDSVLVPETANKVVIEDVVKGDTLWGLAPPCIIDIDTIAPDVKIIDPADSTTFLDAIINIRWMVDSVLQSTELLDTISEGVNVIKRRAVDTAGNVGVDSITVFGDFTAPIVEIISPSESDSLNDSLVVVKWMVDSVLQSIDTIETLTEGENVIIRSASDSIGNVGTDTVKVYADWTAPVVSILKPEDSLLTNDSLLTIEWAIDGVKQDSLTSEVLVEGENTIIRTAMDDYGNSGSDTVTVIADFTAPIVEIVSPQTGLQTNDSTITIDWKVDGVIQTDQLMASIVSGENTIIRTATDDAGNVGADTITIIGDFVAPVVDIATPTDSTITNEHSITVEWSVDGILQATQNSATLIEGENQLIRSATDAAGNRGADTVVVFADYTAPDIIILSPENGTLTNLDTINVVYVVEGDTLEVEKGLTEGENLLTITGSDEAGNEGSSSVTVVADFTAPEVSISSPVAGLITNQSSLAVAWAVDGIAQTTELTTTIIEGSNKIIRTATDAAGNRGADTVVVTGDFTAPVVKITSPNSGLITNATSLTLSWTVDGVIQTTDLSATLVEGENKIIRSSVDAAGNIGADTIDVIADFTSPVVTITSPVEGVVLNDSTISVTWSVDGVAQTTDLSASLIEGTNQIIRTATDAAGNTGADTVAVTADFTAPVVEIISPATGTLTKDSVITLEWSIDGVVDSSEYSLVEGLNTITKSSTDAAGNIGADTITVIGDWTAPVITIISPESGSITNSDSILVTYEVEGDTLSEMKSLIEGENYLTVSKADAAGNVGTATVTVTADFTAPVVEITTPAEGFATNESSITVAWTVDGTAQTTELTATIVEGTNQIIRTATDVAGNIGVDTVTVTGDFTAPVVEITSPASGIITNATSVSLNWTVDGVVQTTDLSASLVEGANRIIRTATDAAGNVGADTIEVIADFTAPVVTISTPVEGAMLNDSVVSVAWSVDGVAQTTDLLASLVEGSNQIIRTATDAAGNTGADTVTVTADFTAPVVEIISPATGTLTKDSVIILVWSVDGVVDSSDYTLIEGSNTITKTATDAAGNVGSDTITVIGDWTAPVITIISPESGSITNSDSILVTYEVEGDTLSEIKSLIEGENNLSVSKADAAGNVGTATVTVTADFTAPVVEITSPIEGLVTNESSIAVAWTVDGIAQTTELTAAIVEGSNQIIRTATDAAGNIGADTVTVTGDFTAPVVTIVTPSNGDLFNTKDITVEWSVDGILQEVKNSETLVEGSNQIVRSVTDDAGNIGADTATVIADFTAPVITIISPEDGTVTNKDTVHVLYLADTDTLEAVKNLTEGENTLTITGSDAAGNVGSATLTIIADFTAPVVAITSPVDGFVTRDSIIAVAWTVDGTEQTEQVTEALVEGENTLVRTVTDIAGNRGSDSVTVTVDPCADTTVIKAFCKAYPSIALVGDTISFPSFSWSKTNLDVIYKWDFDGDGTTDYNSDSAKSPTNTFLTPGLKLGQYLIEDSENNLDSIWIPITVESSYPSAILTVDTTVDSEVVTYISLYDSTNIDSVRVWFIKEYDILDTIISNKSLIPDRNIKGLKDISHIEIVNPGIWQIGQPSNDTYKAPSGKNVIATNLHGNYPSKCTTYFVLPKEKYAPLLSFNHSYYTATYWDSDRLTVEISSDNRETWTVLSTFRGGRVVWEREVIDLSDYIGQDADIRFLLQTDGSDTREGWYIDLESVWGVKVPVPNAQENYHISVELLTKTGSEWLGLEYDANSNFEFLNYGYNDTVLSYKEIDILNRLELTFPDTGTKRWKIGFPNDTIARVPNKKAVLGIGLNSKYSNRSNDFVDIILNKPFTNLVFQSWIMAPADGRDYGEILFSSDGQNWTRLLQLFDIDTLWSVKDIELPPFDSTAVVRFHFLSDGYPATHNQQGWFVDNIATYNHGENDSITTNVITSYNYTIDTNFATVTSGANIVEITPEGFCGESYKLPVVFDKKPFVQITEPTYFNHYENDSEMPLSWTVNGEIYSDTITLDKDTTIIITAKYDDGTTGADTVHVFIDTVAPVIEITYPVVDTFFTNQKEFTIRWIADSVSKEETIRLRYPFRDTTLVITETDLAGNTSNEYIPVVFDSIAPVVAFTSPDPHMIFPDSSIEILYTIDGIAYDTLLVFQNRGLNVVTVSDTDRTGNIGTASLNTYFGTTVPVVTGTNVNEALLLLGESSLEFDTIWIENDTVETGKVIAQVPFSGDTVQFNTSVEVIVSLGQNAKDIKVSNLDVTGVETDSKTLEMSGTATVYISNTGNADITQPFIVALFEDVDKSNSFTPEDVTIGLDTLTSLLSNIDTTLSFTINSTTSFSGNPLFVHADFENTIDEITLSNNVTHSMADCKRDTTSDFDFTPTVEWRSNLFASKWYTDGSPDQPVIINTNDDNGDGIINHLDIPDVIVVHRTSPSNSSNINDYEVTILSGIDGEVINSFPFEFGQPNSLHTSPAVADVDNDGIPEIFFMDLGSELWAVNLQDGSVKWHSPLYGATWEAKQIDVADIDNDGYGEILIGSSLYNHDGTLRHNFHPSILKQSFIADINNDGKQEIIGSYSDTVYNHLGEGVMKFNRRGFATSYSKAGVMVVEAMNSPLPEVIFPAQYRDSSTLFITNANNDTLIYSNSGNVDPVTGLYRQLKPHDIVADFDADSVADILYTSESSVILTSITGEVVWDKDLLPEVGIPNGGINLAAFDLDGNGTHEVIAATEKKLYFLDGKTGEIINIIDLEPYTHRYSHRPTHILVADIDNDNSAELVLNYQWAPFILVIGEKNGKWSDTRGIWNNYHYHETNINDDGSLPQYEEVPKTYRVQPVENRLSCKDLTLSKFQLSSINCPDTLTVSARVGNGGVLQAQNGISVSMFLGTVSLDNFVGSVKTTKVLQPGEYEDISITTNLVPRGEQELLLVVDADSTGSGTYAESDEDNNHVKYTFTICNNAPSFISEVSDSVVEVGNMWSYTALAEDSDGDSVTYSLENAIHSVTIDSITGVCNWNPYSYNKNRLQFKIVATDPFGAKGFQNVTLYYNVAGNNSPVFTSTMDSTVEANNFYRDTLTATDIDSDKLHYFLLDGPANNPFTIDELTGEVVSAGNPDFIDSTFPITAVVTDYKNGWDTLTFSVKTIENIGNNNPPVFISNPDSLATQGVTYSYQPVLMDFDNDSITYWLMGAPKGFTLDSLTYEWTPSWDQVGEHSLAIAATDKKDTVYQQFKITVANVNDAPFIKQVTDTILVSGQDYSLALNIKDYDSDPVTTSLINGPSGMTLDSDTIKWIADGIGNQYQVTVEAEDSIGDGSRIYWTVSVIADTVKPSGYLTYSFNPVQINETTMLKAVVSDNIGVKSVVLKLDTLEIPLNDDLEVPFVGYALGQHKFQLIVEDLAGNIDTSSSVLTVSSYVDNEGPSVSITAMPQSVTAGETVTFTISASDNDGLDKDRVWFNINNRYVPVDSNGVATWIAPYKGEFTALATAYDSAGNYGQDYTNVTVTASGDDNAKPSIAILSPLDTMSHGAVKFYGTVTDPNLAYFTLNVKPVQGTEWQEVYRSTTPVTDSGYIGSVDGTLLDNGSYDVGLFAYDTHGNYSGSSTGITITGMKKIGHFTLAFTDMNINLPGMGLSVGRVYDSRNKEIGDFGYGWDMTMKSIKLSQSCKQGEFWKVTNSPSSPLAGYSITPVRPHTITVSIPGGRDQVFDVVPRLQNRYNPSAGYMTYEAQPGTYSTLEPLNTGDLYITGGIFYDVNGDFTDTYNPQKYKLTLADGTEYLFDKDEGITKVTTQSQTSITFHNNSIEHSDGDSLQINRDAQNRVTSITDISGRVVSYAYDQHGNLSTFTDPEGNKTTFRYGPNHYLEDIIDARGIRAIKTIYDDAGRTLYQLNAEGDTLHYNHDTENGIEKVKDFEGHEKVFEYDVRGNVSMEVNALGDTTRYEYDDKDNRIKTIYPDGANEFTAYDVLGRVIEEVDALGRKTTFTYLSPGESKNTVMQNAVISKTDALGRTTTFDYDPNGFLRETIGPDGQSQGVTVHNSRGGVKFETNALGDTVTKNIYDGFDVLGTVNAVGGVTYYKLDERKNIIREISPSNDTSHYFYDKNDNQIMAIGGRGDTTRTEYNIFGKISKQIDAFGKVTTYEYDAFGQKVATINSVGDITKCVYDKSGNIITSIDAEGRKTHFEYNAKKRVTKTIFSDSSVTEIMYTSRGFQEYTIDARGNKTEYFYDSVGNNIVVKDALGNETKYEYDRMNRKVAMVDALLRRTTYEYDDYDRLVKTTYHDGTYVTTTYDAAGRKISETDAEENTTTYTYFADGNLESVTDAMNNVTTYTYDKQGNRLTQTDALNRTTEFVYNKQNQMIEKHYPVLDSINQYEYYYYDKGRLSQTIKGTDTTLYSYDDLNREIYRWYSNSGHTVETEYHKGKVKSVTDYRGKTTNEYNNRVKLAKVINPDGTFLSYEYDSVGNKTLMLTSLDTTQYTYDELNRMKLVINGEDTTEYFYNPVGSRDSVSFANGTATAYEYSDLNRLTRVTNYSATDSIISSFEYTLNKAGIRTAVKELDAEVIYVYDDLYRLLSETRTGTHPYTIAYTYDEVSNRKTMVKDGVETAYEYNDRGQIIKEITPTDTTTYNYDLVGRMSKKTTGADSELYEWVDRDRLSKITKDGSEFTYEYDYAGIKVKEGEKRLLVDHTQRFAQVVGEIVGTDSVSYTYGLERIAQNRSVGSHFYIADGQGSIRQLTDGSGAVSDEYGYTAFGEDLYSVGCTDNNFRYTGETWDANAGFYYLRARWMDPALGRFISVDPYAGDPMAPVSLHRYLYANNCPISMSDPSGLFTLSEINVTTIIESILYSYNYEQYFGALANMAMESIDVSITILDPAFVKRQLGFHVLMMGYIEVGMEMIRCAEAIIEKGMKIMGQNMCKSYLDDMGQPIKDELAKIKIIDDIMNISDQSLGRIEIAFKYQEEYDEIMDQLIELINPASIGEFYKESIALAEMERESESRALKRRQAYNVLKIGQTIMGMLP